MSTLIAVYNSEGCVGRCDAKCYDAKSPACDCICRGRNHGAGIERASETTRDIAESWVGQFAESRGLDKAKLRTELLGPAVQESLL
jgi:hypothetical protein